MNMKKALFAALTLLTVLPAAQACTFNNQASSDLRAAVGANGGWPISDAQCAILNAKKLTLVADSFATVLDGASVAWVMVSLQDTSYNIRSDAGQSSTYVNAKKPSMDWAKSMLNDAARDAIKGLDFAKAASEIEAYRAKAIKAGAKR